jgi:hypothetical protein
MSIFLMELHWMYCSLVRRDLVLPWKLMMSNYYWIQEGGQDEEQNAEASQNMELSKILRTKLGARRYTNNCLSVT